MTRRPDFSNGPTWRVEGVPGRFWQDIYPRLMGASWTATIGLAFAAYAVASLLFALLFALRPEGVEGASSFVDLIWFSVQTLSTIGYGGMTPVTPWANLLVLIESFIGLAGVAVVTAILYAKFSLPEARVRFAEKLAVHGRDGVPTLHLRMLNERTTPILDLEIHIGVLVEVGEGENRFRRLHDVKLVRNRIPVFAMAFTIMHRLDESSVLGPLQDDPERMLFMIVTIRGVDDRTLQPVFARKFYGHDDLVWGRGYADMVETSDEGEMVVHAEKLSHLEPREV